MQTEHVTLPLRWKVVSSRDAAPKEVESVPLANFKPHALHSVPFPDGPERHCVVMDVWQCSHTMYIGYCSLDRGGMPSPVPKDPPFFLNIV